MNNELNKQPKPPLGELKARCLNCARIEEKIEQILSELLGTSNLTTGAVPKMVHGYGFCTIELTGVVTEENLIRVFEKYSVKPPESGDVRTEREKVQEDIEKIIAEFSDQPELCLSIIDEYFNGKQEVIY